MNWKNYLFAAYKDTNDWNWNLSLPSESTALAPCFASIPLPLCRTIKREGLHIVASEGGITCMSSMSSQRKKNFVFRPKRLAWNPIILGDRKRRPWKMNEQKAHTFNKIFLTIIAQLVMLQRFQGLSIKNELSKFLRGNGENEV